VKQWIILTLWSNGHANEQSLQNQEQSLYILTGASELMTDKASNINNAKEILEQANQLFKKKRYQRVIDLLIPIMSKTKGNKAYKAFCTILAKSYYKNDDSRIALQHFDKLIAKYPDESNYYYLAGICAMSLNLHPQAQAYFTKSLEVKPLQSSCLLNIAASYRHTNQPEKASPYYKTLLKDEKYTTRAYRNLSMCKTYQSPEDPDAIAMIELLQNADLTTEQQSHLYFALGKIYRDCKALPESFQAYTHGNDLKNGERKYKHASYTKKSDNIIKIFSDIEYPKPKPKTPSTFVFIIGIPRGGKTLLEKALSLSHKTFSLEEFAVVDKLVYQYTNNKPFSFSPELQEKIQSKKFCSKLYQDFTQKISQHTKDKFQIYTDTTPCNFRYMGYIQLMCPNAKFIHTYRNPLDHIFVAYTKYFASGNYWAFNIEDIVHYYCEYRRLMTFWETHLPTAIKTVQYENLIQNPEVITRELFDFIERDAPQDIDAALKDLNINSREINIHQLYPDFMAAIAPFMTQLQPYMPE